MTAADLGVLDHVALYVIITAKDAKQAGTVSGFTIDTATEMQDFRPTYLVSLPKEAIKRCGTFWARTFPRRMVNPGMARQMTTSSPLCNPSLFRQHVVPE